MSLTSRWKSVRALRLAGAALAALVGVLLLVSPRAEWWTLRSYDWLFHLRPDIDVSINDVVIVDMDDESQTKFGEDHFTRWNRSLHAHLLRKIKEQDVEAVVFDVLFARAGTNLTPAETGLIAEVESHRKILFGAVLHRVEDRGAHVERIDRSFAEVLSVERMGLVEESFGPDRAIREHFPGEVKLSTVLPPLSRRLAELTLANPPDPKARRWINYYGTPVPHVSFWRVLSNSVPSTIQFAKKVVFVGARVNLGTTGGTGTDYFPTPHGRLIPGVEVNATVYLNLLRRDWLMRAPLWAEAVFVGITGMLGGWFLTGRRPLAALVWAGAGGLVVVVVAVALFWAGHFWFPWLILVGAQAPCAVAWAVVARDALRAASAEGVPVESAADATTAVDPRGGGTQTPVISDHTLLRCVGRGAYGEVWLARDVIGTYHAVKIVHRNSFDSDVPFEREFKGIQRYTPISRSHPGWVHILHVGRNDERGYFFIVMEAGDDETTGQQFQPDLYQPKNLARELKRRGKFPLDACLRLGIALADALQHLHQHQLIHRDIKPSNVIFVKGVPKFADIGLVTDLASTGRDTSYLGTEGYIAPEGPGTAAADVFSLGKLLYEVSMGRDRLEYPELPTAVLDSSEESAIGQFTEILMRACEDEPARRYQSAAELRADLMALQERINRMSRHS